MNCMLTTFFCFETQRNHKMGGASMLSQCNTHTHEYTDKYDHSFDLTLALTNTNKRTMEHWAITYNTLEY